MKKILIAFGAVLSMASNALATRSYDYLATRSYDYLETIAIKDLCLVFPKNHQGFWVASVMDSDDYFHTVTVGSYIGKNFGRITKITNDTVEVTEIIPDMVGGYVERPLTLQVACPNIPPCANSPSDGSPIAWLRSKVEKIPHTDTYQTIHIGLSVGDRSAWRWVYADSRGIEPATSEEAEWLKEQYGEHALSGEQRRECPTPR